MFHITTRLELNVFSSRIGDVDGLTSFVVKHRIPVIIADPTLLEVLIVDRSRFNTAHKVICAIDFNNKDYSFNKMRDLGKFIWAADGFEILVSRGRSDIETMNEMKSLHDFILRYEATKDVRWALNLRNDRDDYINALKHAKNIPGSFIRTDINLVSPAATVDAHFGDIAFVKRHVATPIKISGNVDYDLIKKTKNQVARFDVTLEQARSVVRDVQQELRIEELEKAKQKEQKELQLQGEVQE